MRCSHVGAYGCLYYFRAFWHDVLRCVFRSWGVFFFKQKTAYEMRISDWSSDVCSSDLMSLHEVSEVEPGSGFLVRDLIRGGEPLRVSERSASQTLKQWDRIGARVVQVGGKHLLSGGVLSFTMEAAEALVADLRRSKG